METDSRDQSTDPRNHMGQRQMGLGNLAADLLSLEWCDYNIHLQLDKNKVTVKDTI